MTRIQGRTKLIGLNSLLSGRMRPSTSPFKTLLGPMKVTVYLDKGRGGEEYNSSILILKSTSIRPK